MAAKPIVTPFFRAHDFGKIPFWVAEKSLRALVTPRFEQWLTSRPQRLFIIHDPKRGIAVGGKTQEWERLNEVALHRLQEDIFLGEQVVGHIKQTTRQIYNLCYDVIQRRSLSFTRRGAESRIEHLLMILEAIGQYGFFPIILDSPAGQFSQQLKNIVLEHVHERVLSRPPQEYLRVLLEPVEFSFSEQQHDELLVLAQAVRHRPPIRKLIAQGGNPRDILNEMTQKYAPLARKLRRHIRHYSWIITHGGGIEDAPGKLLSELQQLVNADYNLDQTIEERDQAIRLRHDQQRLLVRELGLTEEERQLFNLARDFESSLRYWKEMLMLLQSVVYDLVRTHVKERTFTELANLSGQELLWLLASGTFDKEKNKERQTGFIWVMHPKSEEWLFGEKMEEWKKKNLGKK